MQFRSFFVLIVAYRYGVYNNFSFVFRPYCQLSVCAVALFRVTGKLLLPRLWVSVVVVVVVVAG